MSVTNFQSFSTNPPHPRSHPPASTLFSAPRSDTDTGQVVLFGRFEQAADLHKFHSTNPQSNDKFPVYIPSAVGFPSGSIVKATKSVALSLEMHCGVNKPILSPGVIIVEPFRTIISTVSDPFETGTGGESAKGDRASADSDLQTNDRQRNTEHHQGYVCRCAARES